MLKTRAQPNTTTTLNVKQMVTLTKRQQKVRVPWAQLIFNHLFTMTCTKQVVPTMLDNIWCNLDYTGVLTGSFALNQSPKNYNWMLPNALQETSEDRLMTANLIPRPRMAHKLDGTVTMIPAIHIVRPPPPPQRQTPPLVR